MRIWSRTTVIGAIMAIGLSGGVLAPSAQAAGDGPWCDAPHAAPCITSVSVGGTTYTDTPPDFYVNLEFLGDDYFLYLTGLDEPDASRTFTVRVDMGDYVPRYIQARAAKGLDVVRHIAGDGTHDVTFVGSPTLVADGDECNPSCDSTSVAKQEDETFNAFINDMATSGGSAEEIKTWYGTDNFSNVFSVTPAQVDLDASNNPYVHTELQNPHYHPDGTTVFKGYAHLTIPPAALNYWFHVDDPSSLTSSSMIGTSGSGTVDVSVASDGSLVVDVNNMTFTKRAVRVKAGTVVPRRPTSVASHRLASTRGAVTYHKATPRGSKVRSYVARCIATDGSQTKTGTGGAADRRIVVRHLHSGVVYQCQVRARSRAGAGPWSTKDRMARHA